MKEFDLLKSYRTVNKRVFNKNYRTIKNRIIATYKDKQFYDGSRKNGYGGYLDDGRWAKIAQKIFKIYNLKKDAKILQIGCDKGFLLNEINRIFPKSKINGVENSLYPISKAPKKIKKKIKFCEYAKLPIKKNYFDCVIAIGPVYSLNLRDSIRCLKEINRVGKGKSFITLGSYNNRKDFDLFSSWTLLGSTIMTKNEWRILLKHTKYKGDYKFNTAKSLNLSFKKK